MIHRPDSEKPSRGGMPMGMPLGMPQDAQKTRQNGWIWRKTLIQMDHCLDHHDAEKIKTPKNGWRIRIRAIRMRAPIGDRNARLPT
jgi:hypothetical protein